MTPDLEDVDHGEQCPVCGWAVVRSEGIPEAPDGSHPFGMLYVHSLRSQGRAGRFEVAGCAAYRDGTRDVWNPDDRARNEVEA